MTVPAESTQPEGQEPEEQLPENFRRRLDQLKLENKAKDDLILDMAFRSEGIDISKGIGKTARANYSGDPNKEAILNYLKESYEYEPPQATASPPAAQVGASIAEVQNRIQDVSTAPGTVSGNTEATLQQQIDEAEEKGDWTRTMALKKRWFGELMFGKKG